MTSVLWWKSQKVKSKVNGITFLQNSDPFNTYNPGQLYPQFQTQA